MPCLNGQLCSWGLVGGIFSRWTLTEIEKTSCGSVNKKDFTEKQVLDSWCGFFCGTKKCKNPGTGRTDSSHGIAGIVFMNQLQPSWKKETSRLKLGGWKMNFLLGKPIFGSAYFCQGGYSFLNIHPSEATSVLSVLILLPGMPQHYPIRCTYSIRGVVPVVNQNKWYP